MIKLFFRLRVWMLLLPACLAACTPSPEPARAEGLHHDLRVLLYPSEGRLSGTDAITFESDEEELLLGIAPSARILSIQMDGKEIPTENKRGVLAVPLGKQSTRHRLLVKYDAVFRDPVPRPAFASDNPGYGVVGIIAEEGVFLLPGAGWYPSGMSPPASFRLTVEAPEGMEAVTMGARVDRWTRDGLSGSRWEIRHATEAPALSAGYYLPEERNAGGIPVYTYFSEENRSLSPTYLDASAGFLKLYTGLFGPYPFEKFAVVENFFPTGYGFPSYTLLGGTVIRLPFIPQTSLGHEIAHCWWGNGVRVDASRGNWCEGLTTYVSDYLYEERKSEEQGAEYRRKLLRDYATLVPPDRDFPLSRFMGRVDPATRAVGYGKGAMVFHMARRRVGETAFWGALKNVFRERCFREASWSDFAAAFGAAGGRDLQPFFDQWVRRKGAPMVHLEAVREQPTDGGRLVTGRLRQDSPAYDLEVPLRLTTASGSMDFTVTLDSSETDFSVKTDALPVELAVDPDAQVFRRLYDEEIPPVVNSIRGSESLVAVLSDHAEPWLAPAGRLLLDSLDQEGVPLIPEKDLGKMDLEGNDLIFVGRPSGLPPELSWPEIPDLPDPASFTLQERTFDNPGDCLFEVVRRPGTRNKAMALFLPLSREAARSALPKIKHYGKYGYLVFRKGMNLVKGTRIPKSSPLIHRFQTREDTH